MRMRLRRVEYIAIALTFAFVCFMGGYFVGSKGSVNIMAIEQQNGQTLLVSGSEQNKMSAPATSQGAAVEATARTASTASENANTSEQDSQPTEKPAGAPRDTDGRININTASQNELTDLPGIGKVLAGNIVDYRTKNGSFSRIEDIMKVSGIAQKRFEAIQDRITVG